MNICPSVRSFHRTVVVSLLILASVCVSSAQEKQEPETRDVKIAPVQEKKVPEQRDVKISPAQSEDSKAPLPKIENPEFVITGQETIDLPDAAKNDAGDASSFVPPLPSAGAKASDIARTASKLALGSAKRAPLNGKVYGAFGNYVTPSLGAWFGNSWTEGSIAVNARYASSDGYMPNTQWQTAGFGIAGSYKLPATDDFLSESRWKAELGFGGEQYRAYASSAPSLRRTRNDLDFGIGFDSRYAWRHPQFAPVDYSTRLSWTRTSLGDSALSVENEIGLVTNASTAFESTPVRASLEYRISDESMPNVNAHTMHWLALAGDARMMALRNLQFSFGATMYTYRGNESPTSVRLYPRAGVKYFAAQWLTLRAGIEPAVTRTTLRSTVKLNKYVLNVVPLRASDSPLALYAGFNCIPFEDAAFSVNVDYRHVENYLSFAEVRSSRVWNTVYISDVRVVKSEMRASYTVSAAGTVSGFAVVNSTTHKDSSTQLPYAPRVSAGLVYRHSFRSTISAEVTAEYEGKRFSDVTATRANAAYFVFGAKAEYALAGNLRLSAEIQNLLNQNYYIWNGYRERNLFVSFGISYLW